MQKHTEAKCMCEWITQRWNASPHLLHHLADVLLLAPHEVVDRLKVCLGRKKKTNVDFE